VAPPLARGLREHRAFAVVKRARPPGRATLTGSLRAEPSTTTPIDAPRALCDARAMTARRVALSTALVTLLAADIARADEHGAPHRGRRCPTTELASLRASPSRCPWASAEIEVRHDDLSDIERAGLGAPLDPERLSAGGGAGTRSQRWWALDAASRSYVPGPITPGTWQVVRGRGAGRPSAPGATAIEVVLRDVATLAPAARAHALRARVRRWWTEARWYAGDFHVHSRESGDASARRSTRWLDAGRGARPRLRGGE
jgi:hypothetical protein